MKRTLIAATAAALALGGIVTAAPAVAEPRCGFQGDWDCVDRRSTTGRYRTLGATAGPRCRRSVPAAPTWIPASSTFLSHERREPRRQWWFRRSFRAADLRRLRRQVLLVDPRRDRGVALIVLVFVLVQRSDKRRAAEQARNAAIAARSDQQHAWTLAGDDRGMYGDYRPQVYRTG
jgi:hypothetical protein